MSSMKQTGQTRSLPLLSCLFGALALSSAAWAAPAQANPADPADLAGARERHAVAAPTSYRVINLPADGMSGWSAFNAKDQIAISRLEADGASRAYLHEGRNVIAIGSLGGTQTVVTGLNDVGEVIGYATLPGDTVVHAFKWSKRDGMRDLGTLGGDTSNPGFSQGINNRGEVVGRSGRPAGLEHAFLWRPTSGMLDLGGLPGNPDGFSLAAAINDAGVVGGTGLAANGDTHAFAWTRRSGMTDIGTLGGPQAYVTAVSDDGMVLGTSQTASLLNHAFAWTRQGGLVDLGTAGAIESYTYDLSASRNGYLTGDVRFANGTSHAYFWSRSRGMRDLGTLGGSRSFGVSINNKAQLVGASATASEQDVAIIWTARDGMVDLNTRLRHAPGVQVGVAFAISDAGTILARSNAGYVLLKPDCGCPGPHTVGAIQAPDTVAVGHPYDASVAFAGGARAAQYNVSWSWGDGSGEQQGNASARDGAGSASASHRFKGPGVYQVSVKVGDRSGQPVTVGRTVVVYGAVSGGGAAGSGAFHPHTQTAPRRAGSSGTATFAFYAPGAAAPAAVPARPGLQFQAGTLHFRSDSIAPLSSRNQRAQFEGSGKLNGLGGYRFRLTATAGSQAGPAQPSRFGLRIWRVDATGAEVVAYDNHGTGEGTALLPTQGRIVRQ